MTQQDAFLAAILETPRDPAPRLILADWLEETGVVKKRDQDPAWLRLPGYWQLNAAHCLSWCVLFSSVSYRLGVLSAKQHPRCQCWELAYVYWPVRGQGDPQKQWLCEACYREQTEEASGG